MATAAELDIILGAKVDGGIANINKFNNALVKTEQTATKFAAKSTTNFTGLSRVIQDLPYGFNAISNNLTQLLPAAGAAGLAFSAIVTAVTFAQIGFSNWTRGIGETSEALSEFNKETAKTTASANTEIANIRGLVGVAQDLSNSTDTRRNAIEQLQKLYPGYLKNINLENINSQEAGNAINLLTDALSRKARVQAITNLLTKSNEELTKAQTTSAIAQANTIDKLLIKVTKGRGFGLGALLEASKNKADTVKAAQEQVDTYTKALNEALDEQATNNDFNLLNPTTDTKSKTKTKEFIKRNFKSALADIEHDPFFFDEFSIINTQIQSAIDRGPGIKVPPFDFDKTDLGAKVNAAAETIRSTLENALESTGEVIGNLLSGQKNPFSALFSVLGEGLKTLGKQVIVIGEIGQAIKKALAFIISQPILAIAAGLSAIALGTVISNLANSGIKSFASGGVVTSPTLAIVGDRGPEKMVPLGYEGQSNNGFEGRVVFEIQGQALRGILRRADQTAYNTF